MGGWVGGEIVEEEAVQEAFGLGRDGDGRACFLWVGGWVGG